MHSIIIVGGMHLSIYLASNAHANLLSLKIPLILSAVKPLMIVFNLFYLFNFSVLIANSKDKVNHYSRLGMLRLLF